VKVVHLAFVAIGLLILALAAPLGVGLASATEPVQRDPGAPPGRARYIFFHSHGGK
jgi:hypothetical protein